MPPIDTSSPGPITQPIKDAEESPFLTSMLSSSTDRPVDSYNLPLKYLLQVTDSELQNMSRQVPTSQKMSMAGDDTTAITQLVLRPVSSGQSNVLQDNVILSDIIKIPVSERGIEKYQLKPDPIESQGFKSVCTKQCDQYESNPVSYSNFKSRTFKSQQPQSGEKFRQQISEDNIGGRKRKLPTKPGRHICHFCGLGCAKPSVLEKHIRSHTGERPYPCVACGVFFKTKSNLYKHNKSRAHAVKAGLGQIPTSTSSEMTSTEGEGDNEDANESEETQTETSDTDGENEEKQMKHFRKEQCLSDPLRLKRGYSESDAKIRIEEFQEKKSTSLTENCFLGDQHQSINVTKVTSSGSSNTTNTVTSVNIHGEISKASSLELHTDSPLHHSGNLDSKCKLSVSSMTGHTPVYLPDKRFYDVPQISKLPETNLNEESKEDILIPVADNVVAGSLQSSHAKESVKSFNRHDKQTVSSKDPVPLSLSLQNSHSKSQDKSIHPINKSSEETKTISSLSITGSTPTDKKRLEEHILQIISKNDTIVNTPMSEPPRQKRIFRQHSDQPNISGPKLEELPQSVSMTKVSIPSILSIPLAPIPDDNDLNKDLCLSPQSYFTPLVSEKKEISNPKLPELLSSSSKTESLNEKLSSTNICSGLQGGQEIKIEIKLPKTGSNVVTIATPSQSNIGKPNMQFSPTSVVTTVVNSSSFVKNPENSVIKGLLLKGKTSSLTSPTPPSRVIKEKSSSVDEITTIRNESTLISFQREDIGTYSVSNVCSVYSKASQLQQFRHSKSSSSSTSMDSHTSPITITERRPDRPALVKCNSFEKDVPPGYLSHSFSSDRESSVDADLEKGEHLKDDKHDSNAVAFNTENYDLVAPKKKGRPKGSKNKPKMMNATVPVQGLSSTTLTTSTNSSQNSILLATLKQPSQQQQPYTEPSCDLPPWKVILKNKLIKRSMSTERMLSQEKDSDSFSAQSTISTSPSTESSSSHGPVRASSFEMLKQPIDNERNDRNSPLKKRKVPDEFLQCDPISRPGVTRAGSEPLMSQMGLNAAASKSLSEKRLRSLPETLEYKYSAPQGTNTLNNPSPVTVPVVVAQPIVIPMKFSDSIQSAIPAYVPVTSGWSKLNKVALSTHCDIQLSLPAIPATSTSSKQILQLPLVTGLVVSKFPKDNKIEATNLREEFPLFNTSKELSTSVSNSTDIVSLGETNTQPDVTSSIAAPISACPASLLSGDSTLTSHNEVSTVSTTGCKTSKQQMITSLRSLTQTTFCCVQRLQPMYVPQGENQKISMYSNWRVSKHTPHPSNLTPQMSLFLYNSKNTSDPIYSVAKNKSETNVTESSEWNLYSKRKLLPLSSSVVEKLSNGVLTIDTTVATEVVKLATDITMSNKKDIGLLPQSENKVDSVLTSSSSKETVTTKEPKRVRIFQGGFRSTEEYTYIRGRGRGKYVCEECGIRCKKPSMLKKHIRTHTDLRPYHCRHCRFSFKTKGNLTKHMRSKAHQKKCLELGIDPVPIIVDESQIDSEALAAQSAIAKETKSLDDENEDDEEDDDDIDDEEETDDADGQFSDSEESARTSFERMDTNETIDTSIDRESECGMPTHSSSLDVAETNRISEVNSSEVSESEHASGSEIAVSMTSVYVGTSGLTATISSASVAMITGVANQSQIDNEIARSLLDLSQRQVQPSEDTAKEISANVVFHTKTDTSEKTLVRQYSFDMADSPERGMSRSPSQTEHPEIQVFSADECEKFPSSVNVREKEENIVLVQRETSPICYERKDSKRQQSSEKEETNLSNSQALMTLKTTPKGSTHCLPSGISVDPVLNEPSSTQKIIFVSEIPQSLQTVVANDTGQTSISTVSLSFTGILPNGSMGPLVGQVLQGSNSTTLNSTNTTITLSPLIPPFQFQHPFQAFERSSEIKPDETNVKVKEDTSSTVIIPLANTPGESQSPICNPKTVLLPQTSCGQIANNFTTSIIRDSVSNNQQQSQPLVGQVVLPNQETPNNSSLVSIIVTNQAYPTTDELSPQNQNKPENGFQSVYQRIQLPLQQHSNSESCISESRHIERSSPSKLGSNVQLNNMVAVKPSNYISEGSHQPLTVFTPAKIVGQKLHSEQQSSTFERHSPVMFVDDIQRRNLYEQKKLPEQQTPLKIQPSTMISNVQLPVHHISRQSPKTHIEKSFSPTLFANNYSTTRQHQTDLSTSTQPQLEEFFPVHQNSDNFTSTQQHQRERYSPMRQPNMEQYSAPQNQVNRYSPNQQLNMDRYPKTQQQMEIYSPTQPLNADKYSPTKQINMDKYSTTQLQLERYPTTQQQKIKHYNPVHQNNVERYSPTRQLHVDRYSTVQQHVDMYSLSQQHADLLPSQNYAERVSPYPPLERLSSPRHHRFSPTRQFGDRISPTRHVNRLSPTRQHVSRLSPTHHVDRFSPTWQYTDKLSPTRLGVERLSPSRQHSERLSPSQQFITRFSPTRQTNRMSQNVDLVSNPKPHVDLSLECQSPTRQIIRMSPQPFNDKISGSAQVSRIPSKSNETLGQIPIEPSSANLSEQQSTDRSVPESTTEKVIIEKHLSYRHLEPQVSSKILGCNAASKPNETPCVEKQHVVTNMSTSCSQTMQKSFKEDLNRCRDCNKKFSTSQDYTVHRRQHMKTHRSEDATTSHTRPHLHKCFHSEGHAESRSMSTEEIPKPPDCVNCKVDFWKQNHLPKHLWAKTHKMTLEKLRNKHSSSSDSEPANLADSVSETISHSTSAVTVVAPSRVETIPASEKALDLSRDESLTVTQTSAVKTSSLITTASVSNAANIQSVSVSSEPTFRLSEEENKMTGLETPSQPQFLLQQRPLHPNYLEPYNDSSIKIKDEPPESDKWSSVRNHQWLRVTNNSTEMTGTGIIPVMSVMAVTSPNMCNLCQAVFPSHHQLQSHILVHKNHRPYVCKYCDAGFTKKQSLKIHLQTHSLDKPYICDICGDTFASADKRSDHYQIHSEAHHRSEDSIAPAYHQQLHQVVSPLPKAYTSSQELYMTLTQLPSNQTSLPETSAIVQQKHVPFRTHLHQDQQYLEIRSANVVESPAVAVSAPILTTAISPDSSSISKP